ncbi:COG4223 family protein [uncultured Roseobacter sp.]|uniref:COG4223 family protein n=1 Tax=uncultured Roseobacter sp. TaxID=114847 RepID=UPI00262DB06B|nr:mitofilin family membrane protein [uncultured Roseobacter sp.]
MDSLAKSRKSDDKTEDKDLRAGTGTEEVTEPKEDSTGDAPEAEKTAETAHAAEESAGTEAETAPDDAPEPLDAKEADTSDTDDQAKEAQADADTRPDAVQPEEEILDGEILEAGDTTDDVTDAEAAAAAEAEDAREETAPEPEPEPEPQQTQPVPVRQEVIERGSMWPAVFGGVIAAMIGFIAGRGDQLDAWLPASMQRGSVDLTEVETQMAGLEAAAGAQDARLAELEARPVPEPQTPVDLDSVNEALDAINTSIEGITARIDALEARPVAVDAPQPDVGSEDIAALQSVLDAQQAALEAQTAEIAALNARADDAANAARSEAQRILAQAALTRVVTAVDTGEAFAPELDALEEVVPVEVPEALKTAAAEGVPTMAALRESFPDAARRALSAARSEVPESEVEGIGGFLRRQLSARSITPREGNDPDAVLSRAEAAVRQGDLSTALSEMQALPEPARAAMQDWLSAAEARSAARDAASTLSDSLQSN